MQWLKGQINFCLVVNHFSFLDFSLYSSSLDCHLRLLTSRYGHITPQFIFTHSTPGHDVGRSSIYALVGLQSEQGLRGTPPLGFLEKNFELRGKMLALENKNFFSPQRAISVSIIPGKGVAVDLQRTSGRTDPRACLPFYFPQRSVIGLLTMFFGFQVLVGEGCVSYQSRERS